MSMKLEDIIRDRDAIEFFNNFVASQAAASKSMHTVTIGQRTIPVKNIHKYLRPKDEIGEILIFAIKLFMQFLNSPDWNKKYCEKKTEKGVQRNLRKSDNNVVIAFFPKLKDNALTEAQGYLKNLLSSYEDSYEIKYLEGKDATKQQLGKISNFIYFTTITHGLPNALLGNQKNGILTSEVIFRNGDSFTKEIAPDHHFHFVSCFSGLALAKSMSYLYGAKHVHAYPLPWLYTDEIKKFVEASSVVDKKLLDGENDHAAHICCRNRYIKNALSEWHSDECDIIHRINAIFLLFDGITKGSYGCNSTLYESVTPHIVSTMHIKDIKMTYEYERLGPFKKIRGKAIVTVVDKQGEPVSGAVVTGKWTGNAINEGSGNTDFHGKVTLYSDWYWSRTGKFTFTVENIEHKDIKYVPERNKQTSGSIRIGFSW